MRFGETFLTVDDANRILAISRETDPQDVEKWVDPNKKVFIERMAAAKKADRDLIQGILLESMNRGDTGQQAAGRVEDFLTPLSSGWRQSGQLLSNRHLPIPELIPLNDRSGKGSSRLRTLGRSELSRAHGQATVEAAELNPFVAGVQWNLSGSHPQADVCDSNASGSSGRLPAGVYRPSEVPPYPQHPNCLCFLSQYVHRKTASIVKELLVRERLPLKDSPFFIADDIDEAHVFAKEVLGVDADYADDLQIANLTNRGMWDIKNQGGPLPSKVVTRDFENASGTYAQYDPNIDTLEINLVAKKFFENDNMARHEFERGWFSHSDRIGLIHHELGHVDHWKTNPRSYTASYYVRPRQFESDAVVSGITKQVSRYADEALGEFYAEVFSGKLAGHTYSKEVDELYDFLRGAKIRETNIFDAADELLDGVENNVLRRLDQAPVSAAVRPVQLTRIKVPPTPRLLSTVDGDFENDLVGDAVRRLNALDDSTAIEDALIKYTEGVAEDLNRWLRSGKGDRPFAMVTDSDISDLVEMDKQLERFLLDARTDQDLLVRRMLTPRSEQNPLWDPRVGTEFKDSAYTSTSIWDDWTDTEVFNTLDNFWEEADTKVEIWLPKGTNAEYIHGWSEFNQGEMLLNKDSAFRIIGGHGDVVQLEHVPPGRPFQIPVTRSRSLEDELTRLKSGHDILNSRQFRLMDEENALRKIDYRKLTPEQSKRLDDIRLELYDISVSRRNLTQEILDLEAELTPGLRTTAEFHPLVRRFDTNVDQEYINNLFGDRLKRIDNNEDFINTIERYSENSGDINNWLRNNKDPVLFDPEVGRLDADLEKLFEGAATPDDFITFRAIDTEFLDETHPLIDPRIGTEVIDRGWTSTSIDPRFFGRDPVFQNLDTQLEIYVPRGTPGEYIAPWSVSPDQGELLLRKGRIFNIAGEANGRVLLEVVPENRPFIIPVARAEARPYIDLSDEAIQDTIRLMLKDTSVPRTAEENSRLAALFREQQIRENQRIIGSLDVAGEVDLRPLDVEEEKDLFTRATEFWDEIESTDPDAHLAAVDYTHGRFLKGNSSKRRFGGMPEKDPLRELTPQERNIDEGLERIFTDVELPEDMVLFRNMRQPRLGRNALYDNPQVGDEFIDHGFISTTVDEDVLDTLIIGQPDRVMEIRVPKGTRGEYFRPVGISQEKEVILGPGSRFRIVGRGTETESGLTKVVLELVPEPDEVRTARRYSAYPELPNPPDIDAPISQASRSFPPGTPVDDFRLDVRPKELHKELDDLEELAVRLGVTDPIFDVPDINLARAAVDEIDRLVREGYAPPDHVWWGSPERVIGNIAKTDHPLTNLEDDIDNLLDRGFVFNNYDQIDFWKDIDENLMRQMNEMRWTEGTKRADVLTHEFAHMRHFDILSNQGIERLSEEELARFFDEGLKYLDGSTREEQLMHINNMVGEYASQDPYETVAEMFVGMSKGKEYDDALMKAYRALDGPAPIAKAQIQEGARTFRTEEQIRNYYDTAIRLAITQTQRDVLEAKKIEVVARWKAAQPSELTVLERLNLIDRLADQNRPITRFQLRDVPLSQRQGVIDDVDKIKTLEALYPERRVMRQRAADAMAGDPTRRYPRLLTHEELTSFDPVAEQKKAQARFKKAQRKTITYIDSRGNTIQRKELQSDYAKRLARQNLGGPDYFGQALRATPDQFARDAQTQFIRDAIDKIWGFKPHDTRGRQVYIPRKGSITGPKGEIIIIPRKGQILLDPNNAIIIPRKGDIITDPKKAVTITRKGDIITDPKKAVTIPRKNIVPILLKEKGSSRVFRIIIPRYEIPNPPTPVAHARPQAHVLRDIITERTAPELNTRFRGVEPDDLLANLDRYGVNSHDVILDFPSFPYATTFEEAVEIAKDVLHLDLDTGMDRTKPNLYGSIINQLNNGVVEQIMRGEDFPEKFWVMGLPEARMTLGSSPNERTVAAFLPRLNGVLFNSDDARFWTADILKNKYFAEGWSSSPERIGTVIHEFAHALHFNWDRVNYINLSEDFDKLLWDSVVNQMDISSRVSRYSGKNEREFVAEMYSGIRAGKESLLDEDLMELYEWLGGPDIKGLFEREEDVFSR